MRILIKMMKVYKFLSKFICNIPNSFYIWYTESGLRMPLCEAK